MSRKKSSLQRDRGVIINKAPLLAREDESTSSSLPFSPSHIRDADENLVTRNHELNQAVARRGSMTEQATSRCHS